MEIIRPKIKNKELKIGEIIYVVFDVNPGSDIKVCQVKRSNGQNCKRSFLALQIKDIADRSLKDDVWNYTLLCESKRNNGITFKIETSVDRFYSTEYDACQYIIEQEAEETETSAEDYLDQLLKMRGKYQDNTIFESFFALLKDIQKMTKEE